MVKTVMLTLRVERVLLKALGAIAKRHKATRTQVVTVALYRYVERFGRKK